MAPQLSLASSNCGDLNALISGRNLVDRMGQSTANVFDAARVG